MKSNIKGIKARTLSAEVLSGGKPKAQGSLRVGKSCVTTMTGKKNTRASEGVVSAQEWDKGTAGVSQSAKAAKVVDYLGGLEQGAAAKMTAIANGTGLKWPYSTVVALVKSGTVVTKKLGKAKFYRLKSGRGQ